MNPSCSHRWRVRRNDPGARLNVLICGAIAAGMLATSPACGDPADIRFERISREQGLSQTSVRSMLQDTRGFMWFATEDGLNRFDGYQFTVYKPEPGDTNSLSHRYASTIVEARSGALWVGTIGGGLNRFDREMETFKRYRSDPSDPHSLSSDYVAAMHMDPSGTLWVGTVQRGLNRLDVKSGRFVRYRFDPEDPGSLSSDAVQSIFMDRFGVLWVGTQGGGLNRFDPGSEGFRCYRNDPGDPTTLCDGPVPAIYEDSTGELWIGTGTGLSKFEREADAFANFQHDPRDPGSLSTGAVTALYEDRLGRLWVGTNGGGLNRLNRDHESFEHYRNRPDDLTSLSVDVVLSILEDRSGVLWVGTYGGGINIYDPGREKFDHRLSGIGVWEIYEDRAGILWVGTHGRGLVRMDRTTGELTSFRSDPGSPSGLGSDMVTDIYEDRSGRFWVGTIGGGLHRFDRTSGSAVRYVNDPEDLSTLSHNDVLCIHEDRMGRLWVGTSQGGVNRLDAETGTFARFRADPDDPQSLSSRSVHEIYETEAGVLWIGTYAGLNRFDPESETFARYLADPSDGTSLSNNTAWSLWEDGSGVLWIGTMGGGLNRFDPSRDTFARYTESDGLPNDVVYGVLGDDAGHLWLSTNNGLARFDPRTETFRTYGIEDGLQHHEFNSGAYYRSRSGELFFGGVNGFNAFYPDSIHDNPFVPPIVLTDFRVFNAPVPIGPESYLHRHISEADEIVLSYRENVFSLAFAALSYTNTERNQYSYRMDGFDKDWIAAGTRRIATYTNLDPRRYVFRVKGTNSDGVWNDQGTSVAVVITPPWWETTWAYGVYLVTLISGLAFGHVRLVKREREKSENARKTRELEEAREVQLSMLPDSLPELPFVDVAVAMKTATEVGGDYYDFHVAEGGALTVAVGDASGHGMKAGILVASIKALFSDKTGRIGVAEFLRACSRVVRRMELGELYMTMMLVRITADRLVACGAGMPPIYIYRADTQEVEELVTKGLPLGWADCATYEEVDANLGPGDCVLLMTDGFVELFNEREEMLDYPRAKELFAEAAANSPSAVIEHLMDAGARWRGRRTQDDDITFVVLKTRGG